MQQVESQTTGGPPQHAQGGMLREYETIFLVRPDLAEDLVDKIVERMRGIVQRDGGKVIKVENWGKKKTAYEVKKHLRAIFIRFDYLGGTGAVAGGTGAGARVAEARTWSGGTAASAGGRCAGTAPTRTSRSTTRTLPTSSTSSPSAARSSPGGSRATAPGTSARSPRPSSAGA